VSSVSIDEPLFQPYPSEIRFQRFKPFEVYEVPLVLRNNDKVKKPVVYFKSINQSIKYSFIDKKDNPPDTNA